MTPNGSIEKTLEFEPVNGEVAVTTIYVTAQHNFDISGIVMGKVGLTSPGADPQQVDVSGLIIKPRVNFPEIPSFYAGTDTYPIELLDTYWWMNDSADEIGLTEGSGSGTIPSFTAINNTQHPVWGHVYLDGVPPSLFYYFSQEKLYALGSVDEPMYRPNRKPIPFEGTPYGIAILPNGHLTYVSDNASNKILVIHTGSNAVLDTVIVGEHPRGLVTDAEKIYVAHDGGLTVVDVYTREVLYTIAIDAPDLMALTPDGKKLYVTGLSKVFVIDTELRTVVANITVHDPFAIAMHPEGDRVYIGGQWNLYVVNTTSDVVEAELFTSGGSSSYNRPSLAITPEGNYLYVGNGESQTVSVFSTTNHTEIATVPLEGNPGNLAITPDGRSVYVMPRDGMMQIINTKTNSIQNTGMVVEPWWQPAPVLHGNFITTGGCFTYSGLAIQVYPEGYQGAPVITVTPVSGTLESCASDAGRSVQQFTVSGRNLSSDITVTAPDHFEIGTAPGDVFGKTITFPHTSATALPDTVLYVRAARSAPFGAISGRITVETNDVVKSIAIKKSIAVSGAIVDADPPLIPSSTLPAGEVGQPFSTSVSTGVSGFSYSAASLPLGLTIDASGTISGTPEAFIEPRAFFTIKATGACVQSVNYAFDIRRGVVAVTMAESDVIYDGTPKTVPVTTTPNVPVIVSYNGLAAPPVDAGTYDVVATVNSPHYAGSATSRFTIKKANQHITFATLAGKTVGDPDFTLSGTGSSGLPVTYVSSNPTVAAISGITVIIKGPGVANITASQGGNGNYEAAPSVVRSLVVNALKTRQEIVFNPLADKKLGDAPFLLNAKASSGLPVSYTSNNLMVASVVGNKVTVKGPGSVTITATQSGNVSYMPATSVSQTLIVNKGEQLISFGGLPQVVQLGSAPLIMGASSSSGLPVTYTSDNPAVGETSGRTLTIKGPGWVRITAMQEGNEIFSAAVPVSRDLYVSRSLQYITFETLPEKGEDDSDFAPVATSSSGLPVTFSSSNTKVAVIINDRIRITGAGTAVITAIQAGNETYEPAQVKQTLLVNDRDLVTGIEEHEDGTISLFPNPAVSSIIISTSHLEPGKATDIVVNNSHGQTIRKQAWNGETEITLDISSLQSGVYYVCFTQDGEIRYRKFVKL